MTQNTTQALDYLKQCPSLRNLPHLEALAAVCEPVPYGKGEVLFREATEAHYLYLLCAGTVEFSTHHLKGKPILFGKPLQPGHFFGEVAALSVNEQGEHRRTAACTALEEVKAVRLSWGDLKQFVVQHPESSAVLDLLVQDMAERLRRSGSELAHFQLHDPNQGLEPQGFDKTVRAWAKRCSSAGFVILNVLFILLWIGSTLALKLPFDSAVGLLGLLITIEALFVTTLVLNSQDREAVRQDKRAAGQYENVVTTVGAVDKVQSDLAELRAELHEVKVTAVTGGYIAPPQAAPQQAVTLGKQEKTP